jgi:hypothetical protein
MCDLQDATSDNCCSHADPEPWPPKSLDLTPDDFSRGHVEDKFCGQRPRLLPELRQPSAAVRALNYRSRELHYSTLNVLSSSWVDKQNQTSENRSRIFSLFFHSRELCLRRRHCQASHFSAVLFDCCEFNLQCSHVCCQTTVIKPGPQRLLTISFKACYFALLCSCLQEPSINITTLTSKAGWASFIRKPPENVTNHTRHHTLHNRYEMYNFTNSRQFST